MVERALSGDEIRPGEIIYAINNIDEYDKYLKKLEETRLELKQLPAGQKTVVFYMTREYRYNFSKNTKILYKREVIGFHPVRRSPEYKSHYINVTEGRVRTANPEEITFLDLMKGFVREKDRELSPMEKERKDFLELKRDKDMLTLEVEKIKEQLRETKAIKEITKDESTGDSRQKKNN